MKRPRTATRTVLETERLQLREMDLSDMRALSRMLCDDRVMYAYEGAFDERQVAAWMQKQLRRYEESGFGLWAVVGKEIREVIGQCGITMQEYGERTVPEIGYLFAYEHWHRGYATEAAAACREYGFRALRFDVLYSIIRDTNLPSQRVALRCGMLPVDTIVKHYRGVDMPHIVFRTRSRDEETPASGSLSLPDPADRPAR